MILVKDKYKNIKTIEVIENFFVDNIIENPNGYNATISLISGKAFNSIPFAASSDDFAIEPKDSSFFVRLNFAVAGITYQNNNSLNLTLYRKWVIKVTLCDNSILLIGNKYNPAQLSFNADKKNGRYLFTANWQFHKHPLFV